MKRLPVKDLQIWRRLKAMSFMLLAFCFYCSSSTKDEANEPTSSAEGWTVTVTGKVGYPQPGGQILIQEIKNGSLGWKDTINLKSNYTYSKKINMKEPGYYKLTFFNKQVVDFILDRSNVQINVDGNDARGFVEITGSPDIDLIREVQTILNSAENSPAIVKLNEEFNAAVQARNEAKITALQNQYAAEIAKSHDKAAEIMRNHPPSLGVINLLQNNIIDKDKYFDTYQAVSDKLRKEWPNYSIAKEFVTMVDKMKMLAVGQLAPEISLPDTTGAVVKLSSMRGKYVLLDFWAKWCGPCRQENPNVVRAYQKFKDKGFTVFGVSLDRSKRDWVQAIKQDGLTWTHVSDLKYWQSEAAKTYNITGIPFSLLLDPEGKIVAKNLRGPALDSKLTEIFSKKTN